MRFNNKFAVLIFCLISAIWILQGLKVIEIPEIVLGATITIQTMVVTFYFRKAPPATTAN